MSEITPMFPTSLLSSAEAGRRFGYTKDYVAKLARDGKIDATRVGRQWFVDESSLSDFIAKAEEAKREHAERIRQERKAEQVSSQFIRDNRDNALLPALSPRPRALVLIEAGMIMIMGVLMGSFAFTGPSITGGALSLATAQSYLAYSADRLHSMFPEVAMVQEANVTQAIAEPESPKREALIVAPVDAHTEGGVAESFSDEVEVEFDQNGKSGIVTPVFRDAEDPYAYRFMLVPLRGP